MTEVVVVSEVVGLDVTVVVVVGLVVGVVTSQSSNPRVGLSRYASTIACMYDAASSHVSGSMVKWCSESHPNVNVPVSSGPENSLTAAEMASAVSSHVSPDSALST